MELAQPRKRPSPQYPGAGPGHSLLPILQKSQAPWETQRLPWEGRGCLAVPGCPTTGPRMRLLGGTPRLARGYQHGVLEQMGGVGRGGC